MSAGENLSGGQFGDAHKYYRGLHLGNLERGNVWLPPGTPGASGIGSFVSEPRDPNDDAHVLSKLQPTAPDEPDNPMRNKWPLYGNHWTENPRLAHQFALDPRHGQYREPRLNRIPGPIYGAVLEAHSSIPPQVNRTQSNYGETEVNFPPRDRVDRVLLHLHKLEDPPNRPLDWRKHTHVRTIEVPEEKWRND